MFSLVFKYSLFAALATAVNLLTQWPFFALLDGPWVLYTAMAAGTITGLVTKYILDKRWIFYFTPRNRSDDAYRFMLYTTMGGFTTIIFWGTEMAFYFWVPINGAQYWGGALGLTVGYTAKYLLDRRFVFGETA